MEKKPVGTINSAISKIEEDSEKMLPAAQTGGRQTRVASMLSLSCKTGPFSEQMSEVARTTAHVANTTGRRIT
jgi:hypothetical protein